MEANQISTSAPLQHPGKNCNFTANEDMMLHQHRVAAHDATDVNQKESQKPLTGDAQLPRSIEKNDQVQIITSAPDDPESDDSFELTISPNDGDIPDDNAPQKTGSMQENKIKDNVENDARKLQINAKNHNHATDMQMLADNIQNCETEDDAMNQATHEIDDKAVQRDNKYNEQHMKENHLQEKARQLKLEKSEKEIVSDNTDEQRKTFPGEKKAAIVEWADNNRIDDEDMRKMINVPTHAIPPLDDSDSEDECPLIIAEDDAKVVPALSPSLSTSTPNSQMTNSPTPMYSTMGDSGEPIKRKRPPRQEIDPNKYKEILDEEGKTKFACTVCGSAYTWKKSLSKHWKEKHEDGKSSSPVNVVHGKSSPSTLAKGGKFISHTPPSVIQAPYMNAVRIQEQLLHPNRGSPIPMGYPMPIQPFMSPKTGHGSIVKGRLSPPCFPNNTLITTASIKQEPGYREPTRADGEKVFDNPYSDVKNKPAPMFTQPRIFSASDEPIDLTVKKQPTEEKFILPCYPAHSPQPEISDYVPLDFSVSLKLKRREANKFSKSNDVISDGTLNVDSNVKYDEDGFIESSSSLQCSKCGEVAKDLEEFSKHMEIHLTKRGHNCAECRTKFKTSDDLNKHFSEVHRDKILDSSHIALNMDQHAHMAILEAAHGENNLSCTECDFLAKWPTELQKHVMVHSNERPYVCMVCNADYKWKWDLVKHFDKSHHSLPNPYRKREYSPHVKIHDTGRGESPEPSRKRKATETKHVVAAAEDPPFMCSVCGYSCRYQAQMVLHMRELHQREVAEATAEYYSPVPKIEVSPPPVPTEPFENQLKYEDSKTKKVSPNRVLKVTIPTPKNYDSDDDIDLDLADMVVPLSSPGTHASPSVREAIKNHINLMQKQPKKANKFGCDKLSSADILLPYKCSLCEYRARWPSEITQHMKNHSDEKPFLCPRCSYRSKWKWDVVKHLKRCGGGTIKDVIDTTRNRVPKYQRGMLPKNVLTPEQTSQSYIAMPPVQLVSPSSEEIPFAYDNRQPLPPKASERTSAIPSPTVETEQSDSSPGSPVVPEHPAMQPSNSNFPFSLGLIPTSQLKQARSSSQSPLGTSDDNLPKSAGSSIQLVDADMEIKDSSDNVPALYGEPQLASPARFSPNMPLAENGDSGKRQQIFHGLISQGLHHCFQCAFVANSPAELKRHAILHSEDKPYHCDSCDYQTKWKCDLKKHITAYGHNTNTKFTTRCKSSRPGEMSSPSEQFESPAQVELTNSSHDMDSSMDDTASSQKMETSLADLAAEAKSPVHKCESCDYSSHKKHLLESHQKIHEKPGQSAAKYRCKQCNFTTNDLPAFLTHKVEHSNQHAMRAAAESPLPAEDKTKSTEDSPRHSKHSRKPTKKFYCSACPFICVNREEFEMHQDRHDKVNVFSCSFCSFSIDIRTELEVHMRLHPEYTRKACSSSVNDETTNDASSKISKQSEAYETVRKGNRKMYSCNKCPYANESMGNILRHVEKHGKQARYKCPVCDYSLDRLNLLLQHTRGAHGIHDADKMWLNYNYFSDYLTPKPSNELIGYPNLVATDGTVIGTSADELKETPRIEVHKQYQITSEPRSQQIRGGAIHDVFRGSKHVLYKCPKCPFKTKKETTCLSHIKMHGSSATYGCCHCDYRADKQERVRRHMESLHNDAFGVVHINPLRQHLEVRIPNGEIHNVVSPNPSMPVLSPPPSLSDASTKNDDLSPPEIMDNDGNIAEAEDAEIMSTLKNAECGNVTPLKYPSTLTGSPRLRRCNLCPYAVKGRLPFERHMVCHNKVGKYTCKHCNYSLDRLNLLYQHMQLHGDTSRDIPSKNKRSGPKEFIKIQPKEKALHDGSEFSAKTKSVLSCTKCSFDTFSKKDFTQHQHSHFIKGKYGCSQCDFRTSKYKILKKHLEEHDTESESAIEMAVLGAFNNVLESSNDSLSKSETAVPSMSVFPEREVMNQENFNKNEKLLSFSVNNENVENNTDQLSKPQITNTDDNEKTQQKSKVEENVAKFSCSSCTFETVNHVEYLTHVECHNSNARFKCDHCSFGHDRVNMLYQHRKLHASEPGFIPSPAPFKLEVKESQSVSEVNVSEQTKPPVKRGRKSGGLPPTKRVKLDVEDDEDDNVFDESTKTADIYKKKKHRCQFCPYVAKSNQELLNHEQLHEQESKYNCDKCNYSVHRMNLLQQHQKLHRNVNQEDNEQEELNSVSTDNDKSEVDNESLENQKFGSRRSSRGSLRKPARFSTESPRRSPSKNKSNKSPNTSRSQSPVTAPAPAPYVYTYKCNKCPYTTTNKTNHGSHLDKHSEVSKFKCPYCCFSTMRQAQCVNHTKLHSSNGKFDENAIILKILESSGMVETPIVKESRRTRSKSGQ